MAEIPINYLKYIDQDGTEKKVYPITVTDAVYDSDGNKLSNVLLGVLKDTDISNVQSDSTTTVPSSALLKSTDDKIGDTSSLPGDAGNVVSAINQLNSDMGGMKFFTNISSLGLKGDTATPNSVIDAMPYRSALVVASSVFTNPAWNFPDGRYTLEIISVTGGRAIISLYGKTSTEAEYRMFLNNENNYPSGEWTKIISNADISYGNLGAGNFGAVEGRWQKFGQIITFAGFIRSISGASGAWGTLATIPHTSISQIWFRPLLNSTGNEPIVRDGNISGSNITAWLANEDNGKYIFFSGTYVCNN